MSTIDVLQDMISYDTTRWKYSKEYVQTRKISKEREKEWKSKKTTYWTYSEEREKAIKDALNFYCWHHPSVKVTFG